MSIVDLLRKCLRGKRESIAVIEVPEAGPGWESVERYAPHDEYLVICGATFNAEPVWTALRLRVGESLHGFVSPWLLAIVPPRQSYALVLPRYTCGFAQRHPPRSEPGVVMLLGWSLSAVPEILAE